jgi:hypothetical protein
MDFAATSALQRAEADKIQTNVRENPDDEYVIGEKDEYGDSDRWGYYGDMFYQGLDQAPDVTPEEALARTGEIISKTRLRPSPGDWGTVADEWKIKASEYEKQFAPGEEGGSKDYFMTKSGKYLSNEKLDNAFDIFQNSAQREGSRPQDIRDYNSLLSSARNVANKDGIGKYSPTEFVRLPENEQAVLLEQKARDLFKQKIRDRIGVSSKTRISEPKKDTSFKYKWQDPKSIGKGYAVGEKRKFDEIRMARTDVPENKFYNITDPEDPKKGKNLYAIPLGLRKYKGSDEWMLVIDAKKPIMENGKQKVDEATGKPLFEEMQTREIPYVGAVKADIQANFGGFDPDEYMKGIEPKAEESKTDDNTSKDEKIANVNNYKNKAKNTAGDIIYSLDGINWYKENGEKIQ